MKVTKQIKQKAKELYQDYSGNHPTIHCNRFLSWDELSKEDKKEWYEFANKYLLLYRNGID